MPLEPDSDEYISVAACFHEHILFPISNTKIVRIKNPYLEKSYSLCKCMCLCCGGVWSAMVVVCGCVCACKGGGGIGTACGEPFNVVLLIIHAWNSLWTWSVHCPPHYTSMKQPMNVVSSTFWCCLLHYTSMKRPINVISSTFWCWLPHYTSMKQPVDIVNSAF